MKILDIPQSGKEGLHVSMPGRYGQARRALVIPTNPDSSAQQAVRDIFTRVNKTWRALTAAQRAAWETAAAGIQSKSRLGQSGPLTGAQYHASVNSVLGNFGNALVSDPPARATFTELAPSELVITSVGGVVALKLTCADDPGENTVVRASAPLSQGRNVCNDLRILGLCPVPADGVANITGLYTAKFGSPAPGTKVFVRCCQMVDGQEGSSRQFAAIVPESA